MRVIRETARGFKLLLVATVLTGCLTAREVRDIVNESNAVQEAAVILSDTDPSRLAADNAAAIEWTEEIQSRRDAAVERIDAFLEANRGRPDLEKTNNALKMRKALLLLVSGNSNLAKAAFSEFDPSIPGNTRDAGLYKAHDTLIWWWRAAEKVEPPAVFDQEASKHVGEPEETGSTGAFDEVIEGLPAGSAIRYYLATVRAHIHLKWSGKDQDQRSKLEAGLVLFAREFAGDRANVEKWASKKLDELRSIPTNRLRWIGHVETTFTEYRKAYREFLEKTWKTFREDSQSLAPALRQLCQNEELPKEIEDVKWPADCRWLVAAFKDALADGG